MVSKTLGERWDGNGRVELGTRRQATRRWTVDASRSTVEFEVQRFRGPDAVGRPEQPYRRVPNRGRPPRVRGHDAARRTVRRDRLLRPLARLRLPRSSRRQLWWAHLMRDFTAQRRRGRATSVRKRRPPDRTRPLLSTFSHTDGVEPTNNHAERGLRGAVIYRKLSLGSQSEQGERTIERLLSASVTCRLRKQSLYGYLTQALTAHARGDPVPGLA
jgi:hypothetical protein